jgi:hypothetical protein
MLAWLALWVAAASPRGHEMPSHKVDIRIAGPLAMVEVWRTIEASSRTVDNKRQGTSFDLALPPGAAVIDWELLDGAARTRLTAQSPLQVSAGLAAALKLRSLSLPSVAMDESAEYRIHFTPMIDGEKVVLHYRYSAIATCSSEGLVLSMPESLEANSVEADVTVAFERSPDGMSVGAISLAGRPAEMTTARPGFVHGTAPPRAWELRWNYENRSRPADVRLFAAGAKVPGLDSSKGRARKAVGRELAVLACRAGTTPVQAPPERLLFLLDRSRSMGAGGVSAERALARALVEALPPSVSFSAVTFGAEATLVFRAFRMPTREAVESFAETLDPNRLENGSNVAAALQRAGSLMKADAGDEAERTWLVLLTDGALPPTQTAEAMHKAFGSAAFAKVLVLLIRQAGDEDVPSASVSQYTRFAEDYGGLVRSIASGSVVDAARAVVAAMASGGDLLDVHVDGIKLADVLLPGQGIGRTFTSRTPSDALDRGRVTLRARGLDREIHVSAIPVPVAREWLDGLAASRPSNPLAWAGASAGIAVAVLPPPVVVQKPGDDVVRGRMDPQVLRNALSLAFLPRARACYLSRRVAKAGDATLRGRMKLELTLERGELHEAIVRSSTLGKPDIEECVRAAAWAVEYPRPEHRDALTTANLNLVFQPHTPPTPEDAPPDAATGASGAIAREIDLILGPVTVKDDFMDLIEPNKSAAP